VAPFYNGCTHPRHSDVVNGQAICLDCGFVLEPFLTARALDRTIESIRRDYGDGYRHSMSCVDTPAGWCCASDCTMAK
jgi:hypothetical protein